MEFYTGRKKIEIPEVSSEINKGNVAEIVNSILPDILFNFAEYKKLLRIYRGEQEICDKQRDSEEGTVKNNKVVVNHAYEFANFKSSYLVAKGFKYSQTEDKSTDDITLLNKYYIDENKVAKDTERALSMYIGGTGYLFIRPKKEKFNPAGESPFEMINLDNDKTFVAYSTQVGSPKALSGYITQYAEDEYSLTIYTDDKVFTFKSKGVEGQYNLSSETIKEAKNTLGINPIVEYKLNESRIGTVEVVQSIFNAVNIIRSNQVDNVVDFVNSVLVFYNADLDAGKITSMRKLGAIGLDDKAPQMPAKAEYITNQLNQAEVDEVCDQLIKAAYNITGVPIPSGQVTSGGDTGEARKLGNGYENADLVIELEETSFKAAEREALKIELAICRKTKGCKINELFASEVEINATRHNLDNIMVKVQALSMLHQMHFPKEAALIMTGLSANPHEIAIAWQAEEDNAESKEREKEEMALKQKKLEQKETNDVNDGENPFNINKPAEQQENNSDAEEK